MLKIKIAGTGFRFNNRTLPVGAVYGVCNYAYTYKTVGKLIPYTRKRLEKCTPFKFICLDFQPIPRINKYNGTPYFVFDILVWDDKRGHWINTTTEASSRYFYLGECLYSASREAHILGTFAVDNHISRRHSPCKLRENAPYTKAGRAYGYMCKTPDRTTTEYDLVGDVFAENRRFKK